MEEVMKQSIYTPNAPQAVGPYSQAILKDNTLYLSGQLPINPATNQMESDDIKLLTKQILENCAAILATCGMQMSDVVKTTVFLTDLSNFQAMNEMYATYFPNDPPARSCVQVSALPKDSLIEIELIASKAS
jgi:2-iminobutanoate/2-iminopropanoate deaminase